MKLSGRICLSLVAGAMMFAAAPAAANQVPGATYTGTTAAGGSISFRVSPQGGAVTHFAWRDVPTECGLPLTGTVKRSTPIIQQAFRLGQFFGTQVTGSFPASQQATGTLSPGGGPPGGPGRRRICAPVDWTASTTAIAQPVPLTDEIPPTIEASARPGLHPGYALHVRVMCPEERCHTRLNGKLSVAGRAARAYRLGSEERYIEHGEPSLLYIDLGQRALDAVRQARRNRRSVTARITLTVSDPAGNSTVERFLIRLRRS